MVSSEFSHSSSDFKVQSWEILPRFITPALYFLVSERALATYRASKTNSESVFEGPRSDHPEFDIKYFGPLMMVWRSSWLSGVVVSALASISEVKRRRARLVLRWATVSGFNSANIIRSKWRHQSKTSSPDVEHKIPSADTHLPINLLCESSYLRLVTSYFAHPSPNFYNESKRGNLCFDFWHQSPSKRSGFWLSNGVTHRASKTNSESVHVSPLISQNLVQWIIGTGHTSSWYWCIRARFTKLTGG